MIRRVLSRVFASAVQLNTNRYDAGLAKVTPLKGAIVISVGNIAMGGRGKSPLACHLANWFAAQGYSTALLLRGYKGQMEASGGMVSNGDGPLVSGAQAGDEAFAAAWQCPLVQVRVGKDRIAQGAAAISAGATVIVLDDGFQHRQIARDLEIVSISPADVNDGAAFFPKGSLRESPCGLTRADLRVGYGDDWAQHANGPPILFHHVATGLCTPSFQPRPLSQLPSRVHLLSGIEVPSRFSDTARSLAMSVTSESVFSDHHVFSRAELKRVVSVAQNNGAQAVLTTTKDLARLGTAPSTLPFFGLRTRLEFTKGEDILTARLRLLLDSQQKSTVYDENA